MTDHIQEERSLDKHVLEPHVNLSASLDAFVEVSSLHCQHRCLPWQNRDEEAVDSSHSGGLNSRWWLIIV